VVNGPSGCGKTEWIQKLIHSDIIRNRPDRVVICFGKRQDVYNQIQRSTNAELQEGLGGIDKIHDALLILDDLMMDTDGYR